MSIYSYTCSCNRIKLLQLSQLLSLSHSSDVSVLSYRQAITSFEFASCIELAWNLCLCDIACFSLQYAI